MIPFPFFRCTANGTAEKTGEGMIGVKGGSTDMEIFSLTLISTSRNHEEYPAETEQRLSIVSGGQIWFTSYHGKQPVRRIRCYSAKETAEQILAGLSELKQEKETEPDASTFWEALVTDREGKDHYLSGGESAGTAHLSRMLREQLAIRNLMAFGGRDSSASGTTVQ